VTRRVLPPTPGNRGLDERLTTALETERTANLARRCPQVSERDGICYRVDGRSVVSFCSNDYLGLAREQPAIAPVASGAAASRLVCGDLADHRAIEREFASFLGFEDAVLFPSGFQANVGVPAAVLGENDLAFSDALNHASLIDGLRLARAERRIVPHLERPPVEPREEFGPSEPRSGGERSGREGPSEPRSGGERSGREGPSSLRWWFVESVFSMDGDGPALAELDTHLVEGGCLYLDEAHGLGLYAGGRGRAGQLGHRPTIVVAPLGKAFGCAGAFVCASKVACEWIRGHARAFVFTTGVSPVLVPRIRHALEQIAGPEGERRRELLWRNVERLRAGLGFGRSTRLQAPILPIIVGDNALALELSAALLERGWHVQAIRPPTVPEHAARLRVTVSAAHELAHIDAFARDLAALLAAHGIAACEVER
jgi:8-amino-7-oxononanoate synthase